ncbi:MAG TPA: hypothetical protein VGN37_19595 [Actinocatenispora sp.]
MAVKKEDGAGRQPEHPIDLGGGPAPDLSGDGGRALHADARHLADVATELDNLAMYLDEHLTPAAQRIRKQTHVAPDDHHRGGAMSTWTNPSGRFADADDLWGRYGESAVAAATFTGTIHRAIADLAAGTRTIAQRYATVERRNQLAAKQVEDLLTSSAADNGTPDASAAGYTGGAAGTGAPDGGTGAASGGGTGAGGGSGTSAAGGSSAGASAPPASGGYAGGGADE